MKIEAAMIWGETAENTRAVLDWMGRESPVHMPTGTWLIQRADPDALPGDFVPDAKFHLCIIRGGREYEAKVGDWVCRLEDGTYAPLPEDAMQMARQGEELCFIVRDGEDPNEFPAHLMTPYVPTQPTWLKS